MINGILIYNQIDVPKNRWFIEHLIAVAEAYGVNLKFALFDSQPVEAYYSADLNFCINRTRQSGVNAFFEDRGVRCYNNLKTVKIANDKWLTHLLCKEVGVPVMDTELSDRTKLPYPYIVKSRSGHGGNEVFWIENEEAFQQTVVSDRERYIAQRTVTDLGVDVRIYVLGNDVIAGVKRTSDLDFRSNYSLGGHAELFIPSDDQLSAIQKVQNHISADYAGFDFLLHNGKWILNEIEDVVGSRMLYSLCNCDIGEEFIKYIVRDMKRDGV